MVSTVLSHYGLQLRRRPSPHEGWRRGAYRNGAYTNIIRLLECLYFLARLVLAAAFSRAASRRIFGCHLRATATDASPLMRQPPAFRKSCSESQTARI